jgi:hypothetical protein
MRRQVMSLLAGLAVIAMPLRAQESTTIGAFELRPIVGAFVPTGEMRNEFRDAVLFGAQGGFEFNSNVHMLLGGFFSRNDAHRTFVGSSTADIWQFDAGAEANMIVAMGRDWLFRPFIGAGGGLRIYDYEASASNQRPAGYGSVGIELQRFDGALRFEARDYVSSFESPLTAVSKTRNDLGFSLGFVYHMR